MSPIMPIILVLIAIAVGVVVWMARKPSDKPSTGPRDTDTGWNDPVTPAGPAADAPPAAPQNQPRDESRP